MMDGIVWDVLFLLMGVIDVVLDRSLSGRCCPASKDRRFGTSPSKIFFNRPINRYRVVVC